MTHSRELLFVSPVQPALLPGSPRIDGFHVLIIGLPQYRDKEERRDEQIHQLGNHPMYPILRR